MSRSLTGNIRGRKTGASRTGGVNGKQVRREGPGSYELIWKTVKKIPRSRVSSYGAIAKAAGLPGQARLVGYALHNLPDGFDIPWHRVINARGRISFPKGSRIHNTQRARLEKEGVLFTGDRVSMTRFGWP